MKDDVSFKVLTHQVPRHLEAYFMKQCQDTSLNILSHFTGRPDFVKRWFVLDLDTETLCYY